MTYWISRMIGGNVSTAACPLWLMLMYGSRLWSFFVLTPNGRDITQWCCSQILCSHSCHCHIVIWTKLQTRHCVHVMSPERHHWKPAVQAAAVMLRTPLVDGQLPASQPRPLPIYGARFWEHLPSPAGHRSAARAPRRAFAQCRHITRWTQACS